MRPIDGDKLKRKVQKVATEAWKMKLTARVETVLNQCIDYIDNAPTIEPEQKLGKWVDDGDPLSWVCSECGYRVARYNNTPHCPNCGAKMINANRDCADAMLKRWRDEVLTNGEYNRIIDKLNSF